MTRIILFAAAWIALASTATAQPNIVTITQSVGFQLLRGTTNVSVWPSEVACLAEGRRLALADTRTSGTVTYDCRVRLTATYAPPPPPTPTVVLSVPTTTVTCSPSIGPTLLLTAVLTGPAPTRVEFLRDGVVMQTVTAAPYVMSWQLYCNWTAGGPPPGIPTVLTARRVDGTVIRNSTPVTMFVLSPGVPPPPPVFQITAQWDLPWPGDAVMDYLLVVDGGPTVVIPAAVNQTCACIQAPPFSVLAGSHTLSVRARNAIGVSTPATLVFTRP